MKKIKLFEIYMSERLYRCTHQYLLISAAAIISASWLNSLNRNFANGSSCFFLKCWARKKFRHNLNFLKRQQCPFVEIGILKVLVRWRKQCCAINVLISNLKLSLHHFCLINWCLNGCFISFRNKTMHCIFYIGSSQTQNIDNWRGFLLRAEDFNKRLAE